jgi:hypothetical protein
MEIMARMDLTIFSIIGWLRELEREPLSEEEYLFDGGSVALIPYKMSKVMFFLRLEVMQIY